MEVQIAFPLWLTLRVIGVNLVLFLLFAPVLAVWIARSNSLCSKLVEFIITLPLIFPPVALGYLLLLLLGKQSYIGGLFYKLFDTGILFSQGAVILAGFLAGLPLIVKPLQNAFSSSKLMELEEAGQLCGLTRTRRFLFISLPVVKGALLSGLLLSLARAAGEVGITLMIGGNVSNQTNTLSLEVFNSVSRGDFDEATYLCSILAIIALVLYLLLLKVKNQKEF